MGSLNGATSILRNWIHFNKFSEIKVRLRFQKINLTLKDIGLAKFDLLLIFLFIY